MKKGIKFYKWDDCPNIDLRAMMVVWWDEEEVCIDWDKSHDGKKKGSANNKEDQ